MAARRQCTGAGTGAGRRRLRQARYLSVSRERPDTTGLVCASPGRGACQAAAVLVQTRLETLSAPWQPEPPTAPEEEGDEALGRAPIPPQYIQLIHGKPFVRYMGLLVMAHERGL